MLLQQLQLHLLHSADVPFHLQPLLVLLDDLLLQLIPRLRSLLVLYHPSLLLKHQLLILDHLLDRSVPQLLLPLLDVYHLPRFLLLLFQVLSLLPDFLVHSLLLLLNALLNHLLLLVVSLLKQLLFQLFLPSPFLFLPLDLAFELPLLHDLVCLLLSVINLFKCFLFLELEQLNPVGQQLGILLCPLTG